MRYKPENVLEKTKGCRICTILHHADDLATIYDSVQALCLDSTIDTLSGNKLVPPPEQEVTGNELEPRREGVFCKRLSQCRILRSRILTGVLKHILKFLLAHVLVVPNLVQVRGDIDISGEEQNVVDWVGRSA